MFCAETLVSRRIALQFFPRTIQAHGSAFAGGIGRTYLSRDGAVGTSGSFGPDTWTVREYQELSVVFPEIQKSAPLKNSLKMTLCDTY
jgi:hypothetical protein